MAKRYAAAAVAALVVILASSAYLAFFRGADDKFAECRASKVVAGESSIGGPFALLDGSGRTVSDRDVFSKPSLLYFGYTFCPDICPLDVLRNADAADELESNGFDVAPVFVTVDPERDTPDIVRDFASNMHPKMIGLTGSLEQVKEAADAYKVFFKKRESGDEFYLVDHTTFTYLVLPEHGFVEFFRRTESPDELAKPALPALSIPLAKGASRRLRESEGGADENSRLGPFFAPIELLSIMRSSSAVLLLNSNRTSAGGRIKTFNSLHLVARWIPDVLVCIVRRKPRYLRRFQPCRQFVGPLDRFLYGARQFGRQPESKSNRFRQSIFQRFVSGSNSVLYRRNHISDHEFRRVVKQCRQTPLGCAIRLKLNEDFFDEQGMLGNAIGIVSFCLTIPSRDKGKPVRNVFDFYVEWRRVEQIQPTAR